MEMKIHWITSILLLLISVNSGEGTASYNSTLVTLLRKRLLSPSSYDPIARPEQCVHVAVDFHLLSIESLEWHDGRLSWNQSDYDDVQYIFARQSEIWFPEVIVDNSVAGFNVLFDDHLQLRIKHNGVVFWEPAMIFYIHCELDTTFYPYDQQKCAVQLASWGYHEDEVTIEHQHDRIIMEDYKENGEWIVTGSSTAAHRLADTIDGVTHHFPQLDFTICISRRPTFYILNRILPVTCASFLVVTVFLLPVESGEKVSYALTELLALAFLLTLITNYLPSTSMTISVLGLYLAFTLLMATLATVATVIILWMYFKPGNISNTSRFAKLTKFTEKCICYCFKKTVPVEVTPDIADGHFAVAPEVRDVYSWREVAVVWDKACLRIFFCLAVLSTAVFMAVLSIGGRLMEV